MSVVDVLEKRRQWHVEQGDALTVLRSLPDDCVQVCATSPPFFGLRDYGTGRWDGGRPDCDHLPNNIHQRQGQTGGRAGRAFTGFDPFKGACGKCGAVRVDQQIGLEPTLGEYVARLVAVFAEVKRVLHPTGTLWCNIGDSYNASPGQRKATDAHGPKQATNVGANGLGSRFVANLKPKDLLMVPARVALALQADGWWLRSDIVWAKTACMPESVTDRPTSAHEHVFLLARQARYYFDADAVREYDPAAGTPWGDRRIEPQKAEDDEGYGAGRLGATSTLRAGAPYQTGGRNLRNVWTLGPEPLADDHYAAWPTEIPRRAILAGSRPDDVVLDCFSGSGRTGITAGKLGRRYIGIELSEHQTFKSRQRIADAVGVAPVDELPAGVTRAQLAMFGAVA